MNKILIVEDDDFVSRTYSRIFSVNGYKVETADNGLKALEMLNKTDSLPAVVILDINIPQMSGREILKNIKQDAKLKDIPTAVLTNSFYKENEKEFLDLGADLFLVKVETNNKDLVKKINDLVERSNKKKS